MNTLTCEWCGKAFEPNPRSVDSGGRTTQRFCPGGKCRGEWYREVQKAGRKIAKGQAVVDDFPKLFKGEEK